MAAQDAGLNEHERDAAGQNCHRNPDTPLPEEHFGVRSRCGLGIAGHKVGKEPGSALSAHR